MEPLLTYKEAAERLNVSERTVWDLVKKNQVPHVRINSAVRIPADELDAWIRERTVTPESGSASRMVGHG